MPDNTQRADWAGFAIAAFQSVTRTDDEDAVSDLLCNLMHYCDRNGLDFQAELSRAASNYEAEINGL